MGLGGMAVVRMVKVRWVPVGAGGCGEDITADSEKALVQGSRPARPVYPDEAGLNLLSPTIN